MSKVFISSAVFDLLDVRAFEVERLLRHASRTRPIGQCDFELSTVPGRN